jgi:hypothetical protein
VTIQLSRPTSFTAVAPRQLAARPGVPASPLRAGARPSRRARRRTVGGVPTLCAALICVGSLCCEPSLARATRAARAASTPSTAQILAPSATMTPDALPVDRLVYRCGNAYSAHPCENARSLDVEDPRTAAQRVQADDLVARDKRLASWLEAQRREREGAASEPRKAVRRKAAKGCIESATIACVPKQPRPRRAVSKAASAAMPAAAK